MPLRRRSVLPRLNLPFHRLKLPYTGLPCPLPGPHPPISPPSRSSSAPADPEGHLAEGAPADEYEPEEEAILAALAGLSTAELTTPAILPRLEQVWLASFHLTTEQLATRQPKLLSLAKEIERFFGPESKPRTRAEILADGQSQ